ncbi:MAG: glycosyltransferase [Chitinivibrionales bacterium]|nr:glycosyltransferase [Chitinivibrionales bacterium]
MKILMMSNTYAPFVGGVERSIDIFTREYFKKGHEVLIIAPEYEGYRDSVDYVQRVPAIQRFNGTDFSVPLFISGKPAKRIEGFEPDIVHVHHPFLMGDAALRTAAKFSLPVVFTHHTLFEDYTHYVPMNSEGMKRFVKQLATGFANMCDRVFAPCRYVAELIRERGVTTAVSVVPTGIDVDQFARGRGAGLRNQLGLAKEDFLIGTISRIAPEKNLLFLAESAAACLRRDEHAHFMIAGKGPLEHRIAGLFEQNGLSSRYHHLGVVTGEKLADAYAALDAFVFASKTETQGLVLAEAMAASRPVIALDAGAVRDVVDDGDNGYIVAEENPEHFRNVINRFRHLCAGKKAAMQQAALQKANSFSQQRLAEKALAIYQSLLLQKRTWELEYESQTWKETMQLVKKEWAILSNLARATDKAMNKRDRDRI